MAHAAYPHPPCHPLRRRRRYARYRGMALSALPLPIGSGSKLHVEDTEQEVSLKIDGKAVLLNL